MGDGTVALILDVLGLAVAAGLTEVREQPHASSGQDESQASQETQRSWSSTWGTHGGLPCLLR